MRLVFSHIPPGQPTWPYISYDYEARKRELTARLVSGCPDVEFLPVTVHDADAARRLISEDKGQGVVGYLVYMVGIWTGAPQAIAEAGKPTLFVDDLYSGSGEFLVAYAAARRSGKNVAGVSSTPLRRRADGGPLLRQDQGRGHRGAIRRRLHGRRTEDLQADGRRDGRRRSTRPPSSTPPRP